MIRSVPSIHDIGINYIIPLGESKVLVSRDKEETLGGGVEKDQVQESTNQEQNSKAPKDPTQLSPDEKRVIKELQARDQEVKAHEAAHQAAGGGMTGAASYTYQIGPDGKMYAIGGEVSINTPTPSSPQEALKIARQVQAAAMAVSEPSPQDYAVAASARMMEVEAQQDLAKEELLKQRGLESYKSEQSSIDGAINQMPRLDISA